MAEKRLTKKEIRRRKMEEYRKKQIEEAFRFPFCRRCRAKLDDKWVKELKKRGSLPLCQKCFEPMMKKFQELAELWQKFNRR